MTEEPRSFELDRNRFALLRAAIRGEVTDFQSLVAELGIGVSEHLPTQIVRYVTSESYAGDVADVMEELGVVPERVLDDAYEMDFAAPDEQLVEKLLAKAGNALLPEKSPDELSASVAIQRPSWPSTQTWMPSAREIRREQASPDHEILSPRFVASRYWLQRPIGEGAFAVVYRCFDTTTECHVAVKVISRDPFSPGEMPPDVDVAETAMSLQPSDAAFMPRRSLREAWLMASLHHKGILPVYDWGRLPNGHKYLVTKMCRFDLRRRLAESPLTFHTCCDVALQIAETLDYIHKQGIVHRDVKPANILFGEDGRVFLGDFGLAVTFDDDRRGFAGTPGYMSPEQLGGTWFDGRSDMYSLGITLYQVTTGELPFRGPLERVMEAIQQETPRRPRLLVRDIPPRLEDVIMTAIAKNVSDRYRTAGVMARDLRDVLRSGVLGLSDAAGTPGAQQGESNAYSLLEMSRTLLSQAHSAGTPKEVAKSLEGVAASYAALRNSKGALVYWSQARSQYAADGDREGEANMCWQMSQAFHDLGEKLEAIEFAKLAIQLFESIDSPRTGHVRDKLREWSSE